MAAWAIGQTNRFRAALVDAGITDWGMLAATGEYGQFDGALSGSIGWEGIGPHPHGAVSPVSFASRVRTSVLILHGAEDTNAPVVVRWRNWGWWPAYPRAGVVAAVAEVCGVAEDLVDGLVGAVMVGSVVASSSWAWFTPPGQVRAVFAGPEVSYSSDVCGVAVGQVFRRPRNVRLPGTDYRGVQRF